MTYLGVLCNVDALGNPLQQLSASVINRMYLIDELLAPADIRLFLYCPKDVAPAGDAPGYVLENRTPVAVRQPVPRVNANWTYSTRHLLRQGMGYQPFKRWLRERGIAVYVPYEFSELVSNKQKTHEMVRAWDESLHPRTEDFDGTAAQIESFVARANTVFLKPRAGHKGNRIFVLRRSGAGYSLTYYDSRARRSFPCISLQAVLALIDAATNRERYVMQDAVESLLLDGAVFDVRVTMVHDGRRWHSLLETRLAPPGSDLTNVHQGGMIHVTREVLAATVGEHGSRAVEERLRQVSHGLAAFFESRFPDVLPEIGFDFVLDQDREPRLVEVNAKPGIAGIGSEQTLFDWTPAERQLHEMWTIPHMNHLAGFLRHKIEGVRSAPEPQRIAG